jgi:hypothetical protein
MLHQTLQSALLFAVVANGAIPSLVGTWEGKANDLPGIELTIRDSVGKPEGEITFIFQQRGADGKWQAKGGTPQPLLNVQAGAKTLSFEVTHHKFHGSSEFGPNVKFRVELINDEELRLFKVEKDAAPGPGFKLTRAKKAGR